jgi:murein DD-endopeptidase MepM/ murein hydrolase activator NlpD
MKTLHLSIVLFLLHHIALSAAPDMLTPEYYQTKRSDPFREEVDEFIEACQGIELRHPLKDEHGKSPDYRIPRMGSFGATKGRGPEPQHHPATDLYVGHRETDVDIYAAHGGTVSTIRNAPKYRQYISITQTIVDEDGIELGKLVTLYGHVDLDLDEADGLALNGKTVEAGDLISKHLYEGTGGGPHLHFEVRYYRPTDRGCEEFYGFRQSAPSTSDDFPLGKWDPDHGYGYGHPENHSLRL